VSAQVWIKPAVMAANGASTGGGIATDSEP